VFSCWIVARSSLERALELERPRNLRVSRLGCRRATTDYERVRLYLTRGIAEATHPQIID
jgi:hypothetical protein